MKILTPSFILLTLVLACVFGVRVPQAGAFYVPSLMESLDKKRGTQMSILALHTITARDQWPDNPFKISSNFIDLKISKKVIFSTNFHLEKGKSSFNGNFLYPLNEVDELKIFAVAGGGLDENVNPEGGMGIEVHLHNKYVGFLFQEADQVTRFGGMKYFYKNRLHLGLVGEHSELEKAFYGGFVFGISINQD